jgi:hypothetical protein
MPQRHQPLQLQRAHPAQCTGHKQQRIAGQKRHDDQTGFAVDNQEQDRIHPHAILLGKRQQMCVQMQDDVYEGGK